MDPQINNKDAFKQMYKSAVKASYFGHMQEPKQIQKSKIQFQNINQQADKDVDQKTFRLVKDFKRPQSTFKVHGKSGECYIEKASLFSCLGNRPVHLIQLNNSKLTITLKGKIVRYVDFSAVSADIRQGGNYFKITFQGCEKQMYVEPNNSNQVSKWVQMIGQIIKNTDGKKKRFTYLASKSNDFFKSQHILNQEFQKQANSGDILLFNSPHSAATIQRTFTNSQYDHVGIVLRNKKNQIFIYESTSIDGVGFTPWKQMIKYQWYDLTNKIVWRKLNTELGSAQIAIMQAFVAKTLGKGFQLNLDKIFQFKSTLKRTDQMQDKKTYFCSELVARLYKQLGYLDSQKSSTNYYPVDFSEKVKLKFNKPGVSLSNEILISFDK